MGGEQNEGRLREREVDLLYCGGWRVIVMSYLQNHIDLNVTMKDSRNWHLTGMNGEPRRHLCHNSWNLFRELRDRDDGPWCVIGDLNNVASAEDKRGGNTYPRSSIDGFQQKLKNEYGQWVDWETCLEVNYFNALFASSGSRFREAIDCVGTSVTDEMNKMLNQLVCEEEVKKVLFQMHLDKSLGHDGMTPTFHQKCWSIVGGDVVKMVQRFFLDGMFRDNCHEANVVLTPEKKNPRITCQALASCLERVRIGNMITDVSLINGKLLQIMDVESSQIGLVAEDGAEQWCVPFGDIIKVNVDAAIFGESHSFGVGMVAHDSHGFLLEGCTQLFQGVVRPEIVEAIGVLEALSWIKRNQWQEVFLETDCLVVVQALRSSVAMLSLFGSIIEECENLLF
uniref:RNase H type-1 domain-containing protein n=1 Tax=Cannabis sativa TaxID=3483 RepID=A0A803NTF1_CANSA